MKTTSKIALSAVGLIAIGVIGGLLSYKNEDPEPFKLEETANQSFTSIKANASNSKIIIKKTKGTEAKAVLTGDKKANRKIKLNTKVSNDEWKISAKDQGHSFFSLSFMTETRKLIIYLPEQDYKNIFARTDNGRVIIQGIASKSITAESDNGRIDIEGSTAKRLEAHTSNGKITFKNTKGELYARADNGRIDYIGKTIDHNLDFAADNGRLQINLEHKPDQLNVDARTDNGRVTIFGEKFKNGTSIQGNGPTVKLRTDNGKIDMNVQ